eukprot:bmy_12726T0
MAGQSMATAGMDLAGARAVGGVAREQEDNHSYYVSRLYGPSEPRSRELWVDVAKANQSQVKVHRILSNTHRQASRVVLSFDFPFYGHPLRQITIATGGFIFMGDVVHRMLTATQYVAPLMANFNPGCSDNSTVAYFDNACLQHRSCDTCMSSDLIFNCSWCHVLQRCSSGFDRYRQEWLSYGCAQEAEGRTCEDFQDEDSFSSSPDSSFSPFDGDLTTTSSSLFVDSLTTEDDTKLNPYAEGEGLQNNLSPKTKGPPLHLGTIVGIVLAILLLAAIILAGIYINGHPTSNAALFFIERRPRHWPAMKFRNHLNHSTYTEVEPSGHEKEGFVEAEQC